MTVTVARPLGRWDGRRLGVVGIMSQGRSLTGLPLQKRTRGVPLYPSQIDAYQAESVRHEVGRSSILLAGGWAGSSSGQCSARITDTEQLPGSEGCNSNPCQNGGTCYGKGVWEEYPDADSRLTPWDYTCVCAVGFSGDNCESFLPACGPAPECSCGDPVEMGHDGCCNYRRGTCAELCASGGAWGDWGQAHCWAGDQCGCKSARLGEAGCPVTPCQPNTPHAPERHEVASDILNPAGNDGERGPANAAQCYRPLDLLDLWRWEARQSTVTAY